MKISLKLIFRKFVEFSCPALYLTSKKNSRKARLVIKCRQESEYDVHYGTKDSQETLDCLHQEDDMGLGMTWPSLSSHTKSPKHAKCTNYVVLGQNKMLWPSLPQGIPIQQTWPISGSWPRHPRHLMSYPSDLRVAQFHCNIVDSIHVSFLYVKQVMTTVTTFKELNSSLACKSTSPVSLSIVLS
jgi:hypothetical protein